MDWQIFLSTIQNWLATVGVRLVVALVLLFVSFAFINRISRAIEKKGQKLAAKKGEKAVNQTVYRRLAVNGTLSNFAGGMLLLITHPFRDGDYIAANGFEGTVEDIFICNTKLRTVDNKVVYLPNGKLSTSEIVNYSEKPLRRVDLTFSISYSDDFEKAEQLILDIIARHPLTLSDPAPRARIDKHGENSIDLTAAAWCKTEDYWSVYFDMNEQVKKAFDENGITIPFPQMDVHLCK